MVNPQTNNQAVFTPAYLINSMICILLMTLFRFLPPFGGITPYGMTILGIFLGSVYGWVFVGFVWPSFLGMLLLGLTDYGTIAQVFGQGFGDSIVLNLLLTFILFAFINKSGLMQWMANRFISLKINIGHPWLLTFFFFFIASYIAGITNNIAVTILLWYLFYGICDKVGYKRGDKYVSFVVCGIVFFATFSIVIFPFLPFSLVGIGLMQSMVDFGDYTQLGWLITGPLVTFLLILVYLLIGRFIFKVDISKLADKEDRFAELRTQKMGRSEKIGMAYLLLFLCIIILPTVLPKTWLITGILSNMSIIGACAACFVGICFSKNKDGETINKFGDLVASAVNWDMILLMIATVPICSAMESSDTGIMTTLMGAVMPVLNSVSPVVFVALIIIFFGIVTQFAHNLILLLVFGPTLAQLCASYGIPPIVFCAVFMMVIQTAIATPGASANSAMLFGNTAWVDTKHAFQLGWLFVTAALLLYIVVGLPLNMLLAS